MKCYGVAEIEIADPGWIDEYVRSVTPLVERAGGRFLARTSRIVKLEGERPAPRLFLLIEWPSREVATAFYEGEEYRPFREARQAGSRSEMVLVEGTDDTGAASLLPPR